MTIANSPPAIVAMTPGWRFILIILSILMLALAIGMTGFGVWLVLLKGTAYYLIAGLLLSVGAIAILVRRHALGLGLQALSVIVTLLWALWEIAAKGWMPAWGYDLAGRAGLILLFFGATVFVYVMGQRSAGSGRRHIIALTGLALTVGLIFLGIAALWERPQHSRSLTPSITAQAAGGRMDNVALDWTAFGGTNAGERFTAAAQITPTNVGRLREAWRFTTGDTAPNDRVFYSSQNTPLKIGDSLYTCSPGNKVFSLDPATGKMQWRFDPAIDPRTMESVFSVACRSVGYYDGGASNADVQACSQRVFVATVDGRLIALDARTGLLCSGFGNAGTVDLKIGLDMGEVGFASSNSGPSVVAGLVIVGQQVSDNQTRDAPSGVVRAYDAITGEMTWAWDAKRTDRTQEPLAPGEIWPKGTPNVWNVISADEPLGLVYLGTGNAADDHFGGVRAPEDDAFSAAVVAVDMTTGTTRWVFRTVEHDRWDYDIGAQPVVTDLRIGGQTRRVLIQGTKTGSIFVLDAATGTPVAPVARHPAPQGGLPGERLSPTQPQSVFYPNFAGLPGPRPERLDASHAFGLTPLDAAWCRIQYHRMRYEGIYTPPTENPGGMLLFPGTIGGLNWGGLAIDRDRQIVITNHSRLANHVTMVPRHKVDSVPIGEGGARPDQKVAPHAGTPWGVTRPIWASLLGVPCISPPWGYLAATDLVSGKLLWSQPLGTGFDMGPLGLPSRLRIPIGTPNIGGAVTTAGGLTFIAAAQDDYFRAFETATGSLLWSARLPAGGQASAMSYTHRGRQYVAISATGHARLQTRAGDSLVVYALGNEAGAGRP